MNSSPSDISETVEANLQQILNRIQQASQRAKYSQKTPQLIAVTKYADDAWVEALYQLAERNFGESRPQQMVSRSEEYAKSFAVDPIHWHLIGSLQRNKVRSIITIADWIHSVDSWRLLDRIEMIAQEEAAQPKLLLQVNIADEEQKSGFAVQELEDSIAKISQQRQASICGLMTMAPDTDDEAVLRRTFGGLRELRDQICDATHGDLQLPELSMGMSGDFEIAIEEGATMVRIGSALFAELARD